MQAYMLCFSCALMQAVWQVEECAPDDEHEMLETCRRQEELN
jgi:hypothetical protein